MRGRISGHRVIIALWIVALLIGGAVIMRTTFTTDMSVFLPRSPRPAQQILVDQLHEGVISRLILLAIEGAPPDTLAALSRTMADDLRAEPAFGVVSNGDPAAFAHDRDLLWRNRYLLSDAVTPLHFTPAALHAALETDLQLLGTDMGIFAKGSIGADPTGEMLRLVAAFGAQAHPAMHDGVWVSPNQDRALLMVQTVAAGFDIDAQEHALQRIETAFAAARQRSSATDRSIAANARLVETGPPVFAVRTRARMKADVTRFSLIAAALVAAILLFAYRSVRVLVLALLPVLSGAVAGIASVSLAFGFRARHHPGLRGDANRRGRRLRHLPPHADRAGRRIRRDLATHLANPSPRHAHLRMRLQCDVAVELYGLRPARSIHHHRPHCRTGGDALGPAGTVATRFRHN